jgi:hypothetical protein
MGLSRMSIYLMCLATLLQVLLVWLVHLCLSPSSPPTHTHTHIRCFITGHLKRHAGIAQQCVADTASTEWLQVGAQNTHPSRR